MQYIQALFYATILCDVTIQFFKSSGQYLYWGKTPCGEENMWTTARDMLRKGGVRPFFVGAAATVTRDFIFGGAFAVFRHYIHSTELMKDNNGRKRKLEGDNNSKEDVGIVYVAYVQFLVSMVSASAATILSSPFNYIRNIHYVCPPDVK